MNTTKKRLLALEKRRFAVQTMVPQIVPMMRAQAYLMCYQIPQSNKFGSPTMGETMYRAGAKWQGAERYLFRGGQGHFSMRCSQPCSLAHWRSSALVSAQILM